jgi:hypothetical protein
MSAAQLITYVRLLMAHSAHNVATAATRIAEDVVVMARALAPMHTTVFAIQERVVMLSGKIAQDIIIIIALERR